MSLYRITLSSGDRSFLLKKSNHQMLAHAPPSMSIARRSNDACPAGSDDPVPLPECFAEMLSITFDHLSWALSFDGKTIVLAKTRVVEGCGIGQTGRS
jgi:hypothetical protein